MKKILVGMICDGKAGGVDKHIINFFENFLNESVKIDFLTNIANNPLKEKYSETGANFFCIPSLTNPLKQFRAAKEIFKKQKYDILYMNVSTAITFPVFLAAKKAKIQKIIAHSHSSGFDIQNKLKRFIMTTIHKTCKPILSACCTDFLTCSQKAAEWLFSKSVMHNKPIQHIQNTVDISKFNFDISKRNEIRKDLEIDDGFVIGNVGNICYQKNHLFLIDAFYQLLKREPDSYLVIIGDGVLMPLLKKRISEYGIENRVKLLGKVDTSKGYMNAFDVFALPSNFEGMPIVSVEAQCSKLPCVFSDTITEEAKISNACDFTTIKNAESFAVTLLKYKDFKRETFEFTKDLQHLSHKSQIISLHKIMD